MSQLNNASPKVVAYGTDDKSIRQLPFEAEALPSHLPHIYFFAPKGPLTPELVVGSSLANLYGSEVVDEVGPYATHASVLLGKINATGNAVMAQRVLPVDAGPKASLRLSLDVLQDDVELYERETDGSIKLDALGDPVPTGDKVPGYKLMWVAEQVGVDAVTNEDDFGIGTIKPGTLTNAAGTTQSRRIPIMDLRVPHFGADGNTTGIRIWAPTVSSTTPVNESIINDLAAYPFRFAFVKRDRNGLPRAVESLWSEQFVDCVFKPNALDRRTGDREVSIDRLLLQSYESLNQPGQTDQYGPFHELHYYTANLEEVLKDLYQAESGFMASDLFSDFTGEADEHWRVNPVSARSSKGVAYHSVQMVHDEPDSSILVESAAIFARGGSDGTMNEAVFAQLVEREVMAYADPDSILQDDARYPQSIIYDSGFPLETKYALMSIVAVRKDTAVVLSTHDVLGRELTASEESSLAISLKTRLQLYPDSDYYGTPVFRGMLVPGSGKLLNSKYGKPLPLSLEVAINAANYMGAGNGIWNAAYRFDNAPGSIVQHFSNVNVTFTPASVRNRDWDNGLCRVQSFERKSLFFPALKTVYDNDTSVLNSFFTMMACVELQKIGRRAWRLITGASNLTREQVIEQNNNNINEMVEGRFDDRFVIEPETYFTEADNQRGYSHHTKIKIAAPNMQTVSVLTVESHRIDDYEAGA